MPHALTELNLAEVTKPAAEAVREDPRRRVRGRRRDRGQGGGHRVGPEYRQLTHGIFDDIFRDLGPAGDLHFQPGHTKTRPAGSRAVTS